MILGYLRVSTGDQTTKLQYDALRAAGAAEVFRETASGGSTTRPVQRQVMQLAKPGDTILVWKIDRWGRNLSDFLATTGELAERGIGFRSLTEPLSTEGAAGALLRSILGAFAEYELAIIRERTAAGMAAARAKGVHCGRPLRLTPKQCQWVREQLAGEDPPTVHSLAEWLGCAPATIRKARDGEGAYTPGKPGRSKSGRWRIMA